MTPLPVSSAQAVQNSTALRAELLEGPLSPASLSFAAPELGEHVMVLDPRRYRVHLASDAAQPDFVGLEVSLDAGRPRRLSLAQPSITLGELLSEDAELVVGAHWLFAAPVSASGLVARTGPGAPRTARARRFFIGKSVSEASDPSGAVWLRKPEGSYNGPKSSEAVLFDAFVFSPSGVPIDQDYTITLRSPAVRGRLSLAAPFVLHEVPSGVYEVSVSALAAATIITHFTVNRELGGGP